LANDELENVLRSLKEAVSISPDNIPLRMIYVDNLLKAGKTNESVDELRYLVQKQPDNARFRFQLAQVYLQRLETSKGIVLIEELVNSGTASHETVDLYIKLLNEEKRFEQAARIYQDYRIKDPSYQNETIENQLKAILDNKHKVPADGYEDVNTSAPVELEKPQITFEDVGGMAKVKDEIAFKIIRPLQHKSLFAAYGKKTGGGILLFGPPGCGKTLIARATAGETNSSFMSVGIQDVLNMWLGQSEKNIHDIFQFARQNKPSVLFFDEADALGSDRADMKNQAGRHVINQLLMELDSDKYSNEGVLILAATNAPWNIDPAFIRPGRFDRIIFVPPPDPDARIAILKILLKNKPVETIDFQEIAGKTEGYSGADLAGLVDVAIEDVLRDVLHSNIEIPLTTKHLTRALKSVKPTTRDWFNTAKNYVIYSNQSGLYDDVAKYLNMKK
jgi:transitional endoplasmic reticulum ATPase